MRRFPSGTSLRGHARTRYAAFAAILVAAAGINLTQFRSIDDNTSAHFSAIHRYPTGDLLEIGYAGYRPFREMYGPYLVLGGIAPDSTILVLRGSRLTRHEFVSRAYSFGQAASVRRVHSEALAALLSSHTLDDPAAVESTFDPSPFVIARGDGGEDGPPWAFALDTGAVTRRALPAPERFVPELLATGAPAGLERRPREFVLLEWDQPIAGSEWTHQDLLVEADLLPAPIREELAR